MVPEHQLGTAYGLYVLFFFFFKFNILLLRLIYRLSLHFEYKVLMLCVLLGLPTSMQSIQNLGLAVIAILVGVIVDIRGYLVLEVFFCACICSQLDSVCPQVFFVCFFF